MYREAVFYKRVIIILFDVNGPIKPDPANNPIFLEQFVHSSTYQYVFFVQYVILS